MSKEKTGQPAVSQLDMRAHISHFGGALGYAKWCRKNSLKFLAGKTPEEIAAEQKLWAQENTRRSTQYVRSPEKLIEDICFGRISWRGVESLDWRRLARAVALTPSDTPSRESLLELLLKIRKVSPRFLVESAVFGVREFPCAVAICSLHERRNQWLRKPEDWVPPPDIWEARVFSPADKWRRELGSLIRHLMVDHPVPLFMDQAWLRTGKNAESFRELYLHVGSGKDIGSARLPVQLTPAMADHIMLVPGDCMIESALLWGQIHGLGGDRGLAEAVIGSRSGMILSHNDFWLSVYSFLIVHPDFDRRKIGSLMDFLWARKFARRRGYDNEGRRIIIPPPQPDLAMTDLSPEVLSLQIDAWLRETGPKWDYFSPAQPKSGFSGLEIQQGTSTWRIVELLSPAELRDEALRMNHQLIFAPDIRAKRQSYSFWSLRRETPFGTQRRQTIMVSQRGEILVALGRGGYPPKASDFSILQIWSERAGLDIEPLY